MIPTSQLESEDRTRISDSQALHHPRITLYTLHLVSKAINDLVAHESHSCQVPAARGTF